MLVSLFDGRDKHIDHARVEHLHFIGDYVRRLPVTMERMLENALDWEHLPHMHASSFSSIELVEGGRWGWRAIAAPAGSDGELQALELLLDRDQQHWATSVVDGPGAHIQIHTQATPLTDTELQVEVRFFSTTKLDPAERQFYADYLKAQYAVLYDEDEILMTGRQAALEDRQKWQRGDQARQYLVGVVNEILQEKKITIETDAGRYTVRRYRDDWVVHSAVCPHLLGPLDEAELDEQGCVTCPWHGYRFDVTSGECVGNRCRSLAPPPALIEVDGNLYLRNTSKV